MWDQVVLITEMLTLRKKTYFAELIMVNQHLQGLLLRFVSSRKPVLGKLPPGRLPPEKMPPGKFSPKYCPWKIASWNFSQNLTFHAIILKKYPKRVSEKNSRKRFTLQNYIFRYFDHEFFLLKKKR